MHPTYPDTLYTPVGRNPSWCVDFKGTPALPDRHSEPEFPVGCDLFLVIPYMLGTRARYTQTAMK